MIDLKSILSGQMQGNQLQGDMQQMPMMPNMPMMPQMQQPMAVDPYGQQRGGLRAALMGGMFNARL